MKYSRGTVLQWTPKALNPKTIGASQRNAKDRMVVISHNEAMFVHNNIIEQMDMYKTHDSYVQPSGEQQLNGLVVDRDEVLRVGGQELVKEFNIKVVSSYRGRKVS